MRRYYRIANKLKEQRGNATIMAIRGITILSILMFLASVAFVITSTSCAELEEVNLENTEVTIDGQDYKIKLEPVSNNVSAVEPGDNIAQSPETGYLKPMSDAKYYITDNKGNTYATRDEIADVGNGVITIEKYFVRAKDTERWHYHTEPLELQSKDITIEQVRV